MSKTESKLYELLEKLLREADRPMTCVELYERQDVKDLAASPNRVSDYLGGLWRKGKATRSVAVRVGTDNSRWAYSWRHKAPSARDGFTSAVQFTHDAATSARKTLCERPNILITELGDSITIELEKFTITVKTR